MANYGSNASKLTLSTAGNLTIAGTLTENSDARLKTDVRALTGALDSVRELRPVRYRLREPASGPRSEQLGLIAQEVEAVLPELTGEGTDGNLGVSYGRLSAVLVSAMQEQQQTIETLLARIEHLERARASLPEGTDR